MFPRSILLFAVINPQNGDMGYCSILGAGRTEFGLGIFLGNKGYRRYLSLMAEEPSSQDFDETIMSPMLTMLFANREDLQKEDLEVIRSLGLRFRGRGAWPLFRSQKPGYPPWFLDGEEAIFLTAAIEQALAVAGRVRSEELDIFAEVDDDLVLTRYYAEGRWKEDWRKPELPKTEREDSDAIILEAEMLLLRSSLGQK